MRRSFLFLVDFAPVYMPALSPSMEKGVIVEWKKKVGDLVMENDVFCTVQTDKAVVDYTNTFSSGYLAKIYHQNGETVTVAKTIAVMVEEEADVSKGDEYTPSDVAAADSPTDDSPAPQAKEPTKEKEPTKDKEKDKDKAPAQSPPVRYGGSLDEALSASGPSVLRIASRLDRRTVEGITPTGKGGRFSKSDFVGQPGFCYEEAAEIKSGAEEAKSAGHAEAAGVVTQTFPVYNFKVSDTTVLAELIRTMPVPKPKAKVAEKKKV